MTCVLHECPVLAGQCDADGECYIWRCEHPHAPAPELEDDASGKSAGKPFAMIDIETERVQEPSA